jgi:hypothetical protein
MHAMLLAGFACGITECLYSPGRLQGTSSLEKPPCRRGRRIA